MDINKFTEKAREAVTQAQSIAVGMGHQDIDSEHLALALIRQEQGIVPRILEQMGVQTAALAVAVEEKLRKRPSVSGGGMDPNRISITQRLAKVLGDAENESRRMKDEYVSVDHLFAALAENAPGTPLGEVFKEYNISRASFGQAMESLRGGARVTSPTPEDTVEALSKYARDLVEAARQGKMDPVIGRDAEIRRVVRILSRRTKNNPVLIGEAGVGKTAIVPVLGREIPIIADSYVDREFGTGALKVTPCHDHNDWALGKKHDLEFLQVIDEDGIMKAESGLYAGLKKEDCRTKIVADIEAAGDLLAVEDLDNSVGHCYRCHTVVEPHVSTQWFVATTKMAPAARKAVPELTRILPESWAKTYYHWLDNIRDWCISRQIWWGHRIPVWYRKDKAEELKNAPSLDASALEQGFLYVGTEPPQDPDNWIQDNDVMDTWFSSWLWPFSTMDEETRAKFYPTTDLVTGPDIIFFWVARMIMAGYRFQHNKPFSNVFFTSIIRDKIGRKMSKSLGNSPDPLDLIANYGADGLRFGLMRIAPTGTDVRFDENQISEGRNFANKLYNATRFRLMQGDARGGTAPHYSSVHISIISRLKQLHADVEKALADYEFNALIQTLYQFFWNEYCDRFLEAVKGDLKDGADPAARAATLTTMDTVLRHYLALLHPVMPHITEELWASLGFAEGNGGLPLMRTPLPSAENLLAGLDESRITLANTQAAALYETANKARNLKAEYDLSNNKNVSFILKTPHDVPQDLLSRLAILANAKSVIRDAAYSSPKGTPAALTPLGELFLPLEGLIDVEAEKERLGRELDKIAREIAKSAAKLGNAGFVERAPAEVVNQEKARLADWEAKQSQLKGMLDSLS